MDFSSYNVDNWPENEELLLKHLEDPKNSNKIPLLNVNDLEKFKDGALVRFHGMIQDMHGPEYYLEKFEVFNEKRNEKSVKSSKYREAFISNKDEHIDINSEKNVTSERQSYVVITVPCLNEWVTQYEHDKYYVGTPPEPSTSCQMKKRTFDEAMEEGTSDNNDSQQGKAHNATQCTKKTYSSSQSKEQASSSSQLLVSKEHILNFPIPDSKGQACHLKIYRNSETLKINDVCEFIGFLASNPVTQAIYEDDLESKMETETHFPPSSLVPRIHVLSFTKLSHNNPLIGDIVLDDKSFDSARRELMVILSQLMLGDTFAAKYLLYHLISEVYLRHDLMPLGKFSLNISNIPTIPDVDYARELYQFIELFMPKSHYLPMTLDNMNTLAFTPKKDYECNRLTSGILQLSANTHLVLDETKLTPGKLNAAGLNSVKSLSYAIKTQKVPYDFNYYNIEYECDIPFLILSEGKSMLGSDVHLILKPEPMCVATFPEIVMAAKHFLRRPELLHQIRVYFTQVRCIKYEIDESVQDLVEQKFVAMRQEGAVSADDLHGLLVLARLISISEGKNKLDEESWMKACWLEKERKHRLNVK